jgi:integrase/recombinase XerD
MLLLVDTGLRLSETLDLRLGDMDLDSGTVKVLGKGNKERLVGFSGVMERHLRRYVVRREAALAGVGREDSPWLFPNQWGDKGGSKGFQMRLKRYGTAAGITRARVSPHTFRHTFALWFVRNGGSPFHLQKILGHTSLDMSRRYCELANVDFLTSQRELSPLARTDLGAGTRKRLR